MGQPVKLAQKNKHPHNLLNRLKSALEFYKTDLKAPSPLDLLIPPASLWEQQLGGLATPRLPRAHLA